MITEEQARHAVDNRSILNAGDGLGTAVQIATSDDTIIVRLASADGANGWFDTLDLDTTEGLATCGRCRQIVQASDIDATGPYLTCPSCTKIVRG